MNDPDQRVTFSIQGNGGLTKESWTDNEFTPDEFTADQEFPTVDRRAAFISLRFVGAALKRSAWLWCATAVFGLIVSYGVALKFPPAYQATSSVLLTNDPSGGATQIDTDASLAESQGVAERVVRQLALRQSVGSFIASYTVTAVGEQVLVITAGAPSSSDAVRRASALAANFLQVRAQMLQAQEQLDVTTLDQQIAQAQQQVNSINKQISQLSVQSASPSTQSTLTRLRTQSVTAEDNLAATESNANATLLNTRLTAAEMIKNSGLLNQATPIHLSFRQGKAYYVALGFLVGLLLGMAIVVVRALASDRLRLRSDIANAVGAPVGLSVGSRATRRIRDMRHVVAYLSAVVTRNPRRVAGLAVVAVDNTQVVARSVVSLALSCASQGQHVVVADLSNGAHAARLLGVKSPGIHPVSAKGTDLVVAVPDRDDFAPVGPLSTGTSKTEPSHSSPALVAAYASADLLLALATLDPAIGGDHLGTWATDAVVVVTAGRSSGTRLNAVGEMVRLAGTRLVSVVVIHADKSDDSLGVVLAQDGPTLASKF